MDAPRLSIITVTYNSEEYLEDCLLSVKAHVLCSYEHLIVDNGSSDGTIALIEQRYLEDVRLIQNKANLGFAAANNKAFMLSRGAYILFLNPDNRIHRGYVDQFIEAMESNEKIGLIGGQLLTQNQKPHEVLRPKKFPKVNPYFTALLSGRGPFCIVHPANCYANFQDDLKQRVDVIRGAFMLTSREVLSKLGFAFDPRYFLLMEDVDLCKEVRKQGFEVWYLPEVQCLDAFEGSFRQMSASWKRKNAYRSLQIYLKKWHSHVLSFLLRGAYCFYLMRSFLNKKI